MTEPLIEAMIPMEILRDASGRPLTLEEITAAFWELAEAGREHAFQMAGDTFAELARLVAFYRTPKGRRAAHYGRYMERLRPRHRRRARR